MGFNILLIFIVNGINNGIKTSYRYSVQRKENT